VRTLRDEGLARELDQKWVAAYRFVSSTLGLVAPSFAAASRTHLDSQLGSQLSRR
jgi:hypothetical protein